MSYTIVGVIGHIDHGKTSLVAALSGIDTDTHPEEKRRGITIDLGFAWYDDDGDRFALIDAPGHERYIGNMLAGVSAVDVGLLAVAADQGIQAQTLEHAAVLRSLGASRLIVAITRVDLARETEIAELKDELELFLAEYGFRDVPTAAVSVVTGHGLAELRSLLKGLARSQQRLAEGSFRMPIDRVFTIEGRGCVVAGTPWSGCIAVGDHVRVTPGGPLVRVRELEVHGESINRSQVGQRTAINLAGVAASELCRGDEIVSEGAYRSYQRMVIEVTMFPNTFELRCPATVQMHTATTSCSARIVGAARLGSGQSATVVVSTDRPIVAAFGQACLFRRPYPVGSFAGGRILAGVERSDRTTAALVQLGRNLADHDPVNRLAAWVDFRSELAIDPVWAEAQLGCRSEEDLSSLIDACLERGLVLAAGDRQLSRRLVSKGCLERAERAMLGALCRHGESGDDPWMDDESLIRRVHPLVSPVVGKQILERLLSAGKVVRVNRLVALASPQTVLSKKQQARLEQILAWMQENRTPPTLKELARDLEISVDAVSALVRFATQQRLLIDLGGGFLIAHDVWLDLMRELQTMFKRCGELSVSEIRVGWNVTRKHAIPMLEYGDRMGWTVRREDRRIAGPTLEGFDLTASPNLMDQHQETSVD